MQDPYLAVIKKVSQEQDFSDGKAFDVVRVEYTIGNHGPFVERIPKADFNAERVKAVMAAMVAVLQGIGATSVV